MCDFFKNSKETDDKISGVNNAILRDCKYKDIEAMLIGFRNDHKLTIPSSHFVSKHKANCLGGLTPPPLEQTKKVVTSTDNIKAVAPIEFSYTNIENLNNKQLRKCLKEDWLYCARQLTDILMYKLNTTDPNYTTTLRDLVNTIKTLADLHFFDNGKVDYDIDDENKITSINISVLPPADFDKVIEKFEPK